MKSFIFLILLTLLVLPASSPAQPTGEKILNLIDANMTSENRVMTSKMIIQGRRSKRTIASKTWAVGETKSFTEYLSPAREKGIKMLKLEDMLWTYTPRTDRIIRISGHMLRQSVMGSDLSYEDMMEDPKLINSYEAKVEGEEEYSGRPCWVLYLTARKADVAYQSRKLWVDTERCVPLREELFAKSGKLLKKLELSDVVRMERRWFPKKMVFKDMLKKGQGTQFIIQTIAFDQDIPDHVFSKGALKR